jgi:hypothetical protein
VVVPLVVRRSLASLGEEREREREIREEIRYLIKIYLDSNNKMRTH